MSQHTQTPPHARPLVVPAPNWVIDRQSDLLLLIGPAALGYLFLYLNVALGISSFLIWWFWQVSLNGSHFFATLSRTYCDRQEWRERGAFLIASLLWVGVGPLALVLDGLFHVAIGMAVYYFVQLGWAYFHVVRQHYGLYCLYQKKNNEPSGRANRSEYWLFNIAMFGPFVVWAFRYPHSRRLLDDVFGLPNVRDWEQPGLLFAQTLIVTAAAACLIKIMVDGLRTNRLNTPKAGFFAAYFSLHATAGLFLPIPYAFDILLLNAVLTYPHNVQYMAIVWHYNKKHYRDDKGSFGMAAFVNKSVLRFLAFSTLFGLAFYYGWWHLAGIPVPFMNSISSLTGQVVFGHTVGQFATMVAMGVIFNHYYLDQKIWRVNRDPRVATRLGVTNSARPWNHEQPPDAHRSDAANGDSRLS